MCLTPSSKHPDRRLNTATVFFLIFLLSAISINAQVCQDNYFKITYNTSTVQTPVKTIVLPNNDIMISGHVLRRHSVLMDGWLTKISAQGTILWSRHYTSSVYNYILFNSVIPDGNDGYLITGNIGNVDTTKNPPPPYATLGLLIRVDKYGNLVWSRVFGKIYVSNLSTDINNIIKLADGDFVIGVNYSGQTSSNIIVRIDANGNIKWTTTLSSPDPPLRPASMQLKQLPNGQIICANYITVFDPDNPFFIDKRGYYAVCINEASGLRVWDRFYIHTAVSGKEKVFADIVSITQLPNGDLSFISSYADTAHIYFHKTTKVINIITDDIGRLKRVIKYQSQQPPLYAAAVAETVNGGRVILMDNTDAPIMMHINATGTVDWQKSYAGTGRSQESRSVVATLNGFYFFSFTHNGGSKDLNMVKTDITGNATCVEAPFSISTSDITGDFQQQNISVLVDQTAARWYNIIALTMADYKMEAEKGCQKSCCEDVITVADKIDLCNVTSYKLPNGDIVTASGTYTIAHKTAKGCDSIVYYHVAFSKPPVVNLGENICFDGKDSLVLKTEAGYESYNWSGIVSSSNKLTIRRPGEYRVSVFNGCGIMADTIQVFKECEFEVYMPSAFTPNGDRVNDVFKIPALNKNKLRKLTIFNRYGQVVFETRDSSNGWDGTFKNRNQETGTYIYILEMESLTGKRINRKGILNLIR